MATEPSESPALAGYPVTPPPLPGPVTFDQRWGDLTFVHWPVRPESVEQPVPAGNPSRRLCRWDDLRRVWSHLS